jgi:hypothetical protein
VSRLLACLVAFTQLLAGNAAAQNTNDPREGVQQRSNAKSEWELERERRDSSEPPVVLPAAPAAPDLIEFWVTSASSFRFFIDAKSLSVGPDRVVRYTLVARSSSGSEKVSYEGMRCGEDAYVKVYAFGRDGTWSSNRQADWKLIEAKSVQRWHNELRDHYFCPAMIPVGRAGEAVDALRRGGHPAAPTADRRRF